MKMHRTARSSPFAVGTIPPRSIAGFSTRPVVSAPLRQHFNDIENPRSDRLYLKAATDDEAPTTAEPVATSTAPDTAPPETIFYEGSGSNAELAINLLLAGTLLYIPLTLQSIGRRLWINYKFTNRRIIVETNSPVLKRTVEVDYSKVKEVRSVPRAFGLWGDMVVFLKDGSRLEIVGMEKIVEIRNYIESFITE